MHYLLVNLLNLVKMSPSASSPLSQEEHYRFHNICVFDEVYPILQQKSQIIFLKKVFISKKVQQKCIVIKQMNLHMNI